MFKKENLARLPERTSRVNSLIYFCSVKTQRLQSCESWAEWSNCLRNEFIDEVVNYETQPFSVQLLLAGRKRKYTPDMLSQFIDGRFCCTEVKTTDGIDEKS